MTARPARPTRTGEDVFASILDVIDVEEIAPDTYTAGSLPHFNRRIYGGQVLAQSIVAASRTVPAGRFAHSVHGYFLRPGNLDVPITLAVEELRDGRSFSARRTHALQDGVPILSLIVSFQEEQPGLEHIQEAPPQVPPPEGLASSTDLFPALRMPAEYAAPGGAFDVRHVEPALYTAPDPQRRDNQAMWLRATGALPSHADRNLKAALLAYACDQALLEPVLRAHGLSWSSPDLSVASIDHAMWWHREVDVTQWLLFVQDSPAAIGARGLGTARVYTRDGTLVASIAQEGLVRTPPRS